MVYYIYTIIHIHIHIYIYIFIYLFIFIHSYIYMNIYIYMHVVFRFFMCFSKQTSPSYHHRLSIHPFQQTNSVCCWGLRAYTHLVLPSLVAMVHTARRGRGMWCHQSWPLAVFFYIWCFMLCCNLYGIMGEFINYHLTSYNVVLPKLIRMDCRCVYVLFSKLPVLICRWPATQTEGLGCKFAHGRWKMCITFVASKTMTSWRFEFI